MTVFSVLDAEVKEGKWQDLKDAYARETVNVPDDIQQSFLIQSQSHPTTWRIMTQWRSQEDLDKVRNNSHETAPVVRVFQAADAKPNMAVWDVVIQRVNHDSDVVGLQQAAEMM